MKITSILAGLQSGKLTLDAAVAEMSSQATKQVERPESALDMLAADRDPELPDPGSFYAVSRAYSEGTINAEQYNALSAAAAEAAKRSAPTS